jgi:hypothetical protein
VKKAGNGGKMSLHAPHVAMKKAAGTLTIHNKSPGADLVQKIFF